MLAGEAGASTASGSGRGCFQVPANRLLICEAQGFGIYLLFG